LLKTLCSTPFGIRGSFTCRLKFFTFTTIRAQRLSASEVVLLLCSRI